ncbi:MAG: hypothetical protein ACE5F1_17350 [Planctomycetota bacterium]
MAVSQSTWFPGKSPGPRKGVSLTVKGRRTGRRREARPLLASSLGILVMFLGVFAAIRAIDSELFVIDHGRRVTASAFLEDSVDQLILRSNDKIALLEEKSSFQTEGKDSRYRVDMDVSKLEGGLLQIEAILRDTATGKTVDRIVTYR